MLPFILLIFPILPIPSVPCTFCTELFIEFKLIDWFYMYGQCAFPPSHLHLSLCRTEHEKKSNTILHSKLILFNGHLHSDSSMSQSIWIVTIAKSSVIWRQRNERKKRHFHLHANKWEVNVRQRAGEHWYTQNQSSSNRIVLIRCWCSIWTVEIIMVGCDNLLLNIM